MIKRRLSFLSFIFCFFLFMVSFSWAETDCSFSGEINFVQKSMNALLDFKDNGDMRIDLKGVEENRYCTFLVFNHVHTAFFDISSEITSELSIKQSPDHPGKKFYVGKIFSNYSLLDYKPVSELSGRFEIQNNRLSVPFLTFSNMNVEGYLDLEFPYNLSFFLRIASMDMDDFLNFWVRNKNYDSSGEVFGTIKATGKLSRLFLEGEFKSYDGFIKALKYNMIQLKIKGFYPKMQIYDSTLSKMDGMSFAFSGPFNLGDKGNFKKQIKALTLAPIVHNDDQELEWTIKRLRDKEDGSSFELKYLLRQDKAKGSGDENESGMLGVEKEIQF